MDAVVNRAILLYLTSDTFPVMIQDWLVSLVPLGGSIWHLWPCVWWKLTLHLNHSWASDGHLMVPDWEPPNLTGIIPGPWCAAFTECEDFPGSLRLWQSLWAPMHMSLSSNESNQSCHHPEHLTLIIAIRFGARDRIFTPNILFQTYGKSRQTIKP